MIEPGRVAEPAPTTPVSVSGRDGAETTTMVLLPRADGLPDIGWMGRPLPAADIRALTAPASIETTSWNAWLIGAPVSLLPEHARGYLGRPALLGHRIGPEGPGSDWSTAFGPGSVRCTDGSLTVEATDRAAGLALRFEAEAVTGGGLRLRHLLTNTGSGPYVVDALDVVLPLPTGAGEILDFTGRWARERQPQRRALADGQWVREHRRGMRALDGTGLVVVGTPGFGYGHGEVLGVHLAWSGNHRYAVEQLSSGTAVVRAGELLHPGELVLAEGETYETPWVHANASAQGLDGLADATHQYVRSLPAHPSTPAPVMFNPWEAVYLDHDVDTLTTLVDTSAKLGAERFVLDDGWFANRTSLARGLGDWFADPAVWPEGLAPLVDRVHDKGMEFGLWWEPEAVNPDSAVYRDHPDWILRTGDRSPVLERECYLLDLCRDEVRTHLLDAFDHLAAAHRIDFVKWDHNRDLIDGGDSRGSGRAASRRQTLAFRGLLGELARRHPGIAWESCASGGGRIDLDVLERVQSTWVSDVTDPLSRQSIQHWTAQLAPLEYLGAHVTAPVSHQTGRPGTLDLRAGTAFFGQLGVQWDLTKVPARELDRLARWIELYKEHRALLHTGRLTRVELPDGLLAQGVVARDRSEAVFSYAQLDEIVPVPPRLRIPGLDPDRTYRASLVAPEDPQVTWNVQGIHASGAALGTLGLPGPERAPQSAALVHLRAV
ncbi:alpha-galactosidase [Streptomyces sp. NBC_01257]|uniref:alpha-galactosidase n=1 Tax=Streptomyces sp. NBC_01257 TaxID=2903799 RepID=UPI002DDBD0CB|nr:alpha-galactosidase [Streptomyces sp. NBC_01257]WRZ69094.1 alpha-galactosidase [Streptomyces sp. NBC_01257]